MGALRTWWTLENWTRAADLGAKLVTIVGVLAAINFFSARADLSVSISCRVPIQDYLVGRAYGTRGQYEPETVKAAIEASNKQYPVPPYPLDDPPRHACLGGNFRPLEEVSPKKEQREVVNAIYPEATQGLAHYTPDVALRLVRDISDPKELEFALTQIEKARYIELTIVVKNRGWGKAKNVRMSSLNEFKLTDPDTTYLPYDKPEGPVVHPDDSVFDLGARRSATMYLRTASGNVSAKIDQASLFPDSDTDPSVNVFLLVVVALVLFGGLWLPLVLRDVWSVGRSTEDDTTGASSRGKQGEHDQETSPQADDAGG